MKTATKQKYTLTVVTVEKDIAQTMNVYQVNVSSVARFAVTVAGVALILTCMERGE